MPSSPMHHKRLMMRNKIKHKFKACFDDVPKSGREARALFRWKTGVSAAGYSLFHIRVRAFAVFGDETVDPRGDNG
jgi:hypothetical protein